MDCIALILLASSFLLMAVGFVSKYKVYGILFLIISFLIFILAYFGFKEEVKYTELPKKKYCLRLYMVGGRIKEEIFYVRQDCYLFVHTHQGSYELRYANSSGWEFGTLKAGVVDFDNLNCK